MKELIEKLIGAIPFFARRFMALLGGPKRTVLGLDLESDSALEDAFTFLAVSVGITFIAQIPILLVKQDKEIFFAIVAVLSALSFVLEVLLLAAAWKLVGARLEWKKIVATSCYFCGMSTILFAFFTLLGTGAFKMIDPAGLRDSMSGVPADITVSNSDTGYYIFMAFLVLGMLASYVWIVCVWGAYRELMQVSKAKSAVALILFTVLSPLLFGAQVVLMQNVMPSYAEGPVMPYDLAGQWVLKEQTDSNGVPSTHSVMYSFSAPKSKADVLGIYEMKDTRASVDSSCLITVTKEESGLTDVQDSTIELISSKRTESRTDQCTGRTTETALDRSTTQYHYKINKEAASGWTLCLNDRFGQTCLTPKKPR